MGLWDCGFVGLSVCWFVGLSVCRFVGLSVGLCGSSGSSGDRMRGVGFALRGNWRKGGNLPVLILIIAEKNGDDVKSLAFAIIIRDRS